MSEPNPPEYRGGWRITETSWWVDDWPMPPSWDHLGSIWRAHQRLGFDDATLIEA